jgi:lysophospholipase L1-like esterase
VNKPLMDLVDLNKQDVTVISAGANDVYMSNSNVALFKTTKFIQNNCNTNMIIYGVPHRYDLVEYLCVNRAIQALNCKLKKVATSFKHVTILECTYDRELFTNHGMHLNRKGKRLVSKQLAFEMLKLTAA